MTERERLKELLRQGQKEHSERCQAEIAKILSEKHRYNSATDRLQSLWEALADHLLANGVIVPPCKVGDTVYRVVKMGTGIHYKQVGRCRIGHTEGYKIVPCQEKIKVFIRSVVVTENNFFDVCENFGKTVFLTREEAGRALERSMG